MLVDEGCVQETGRDEQVDLTGHEVLICMAGEVGSWTAGGWVKKRGKQWRRN